jgi:N-acetylglutamate synthase
MPSAAEVLALETVAYDFWRAPEVEELDGWRLRFAHVLTGRANSVWPCGGGTLPFEGKLDRVEGWYGSRGLPSLFQVTDAVRPRGLDAVLARRGYRLRSEPVSVQVAPLGEVVARTSDEAELSERLTDGWIALWTGSRGFDRHDVERSLLSSGRSVFARIGDAAVGRGVVVGRWLGITSMATLPSARRRGHARSILGALARWGASQGCTRALLQVEHGNVPAEALNAGAGFVAHHDYHYRLLG